MDLDFLHGRNLDSIPYHARVEMLTSYFILFAERYGMLPPCKYEQKDDCDTCFGLYHVYSWEPENDV
jgi:hypothetical protein